MTTFAIGFIAGIGFSFVVDGKGAGMMTAGMMWVVFTLGLFSGMTIALLVATMLEVKRKRESKELTRFEEREDSNG